MRRVREEEKWVESFGRKPDEKRTFEITWCRCQDNAKEWCGCLKLKWDRSDGIILEGKDCGIENEVNRLKQQGSCRL
jgi:hypothetical protein